MKIDVKHIAKLASLPLKEEEINKFKLQLEETINYINHLDEIDTQNIKPTSQVTGLENVTRPDVARESLSQEQAILNSKEAYMGLFKVKSILNNE